MAVQAKRIKDIPEAAAQRAAMRSRKEASKGRRDSVSGKKFDSLSRGEKDELLIELLSRAGLLDVNMKVLL